MVEATEVMKRPQPHDALTKKRALELFMPRIIAYLGGDWKESDRAYYEKQIAQVLGRNNDGYEMARELENHHGWTTDRDLVDLMDFGNDCMDTAVAELTTQWIQVYKIKPALAVGDRVATTHWRRKDDIGTIVKIYEKDAKCGVHYSDQPATSSQILTFEEVSAAPAEVESA